MLLEARHLGVPARTPFAVALKNVCLKVRGGEVLAIAGVVAETLSCLPPEPVRDLAGLLDGDLTARHEAQRIIAAMAG